MVLHYVQKLKVIHNKNRLIYDKNRSKTTMENVILWLCSIYAWAMSLKNFIYILKKRIKKKSKKTK